MLLLLTAFSINPAIAAFDPATELKVIASDGVANDYFGYSVSIDGTRMAVGAYYATVSGNNYQGAVYIYDFDGSNWIQTIKLTAADGAAGDRFGSSVSLSGDRLAVGAFGDGGNRGSAYIYDLSGGNWSQTTKLTVAGSAAGDFFGYSVSLSGDRLAVGVPYVNIGGNAYQGAAYIYDLSGGNWSQTTKLVASDGAADDYFGNSVSLSGNRLAVGVENNNSYQGAVYVYTDDVIFKNGFEQE